MNARPITWPTVPRGKERVRVCLHAGNTRGDVEALVNGVVDWARKWMKQMHDEQKKIAVEDSQTQSKL